MAVLILLLALQLPTSERCAAMLLSPHAEQRKAAERALAESDSSTYRLKVLGVLVQRAHSRSAWIAALERELPDAVGPRHREVRDLLAILKDATQDNIGVDLVVVQAPAATVLGPGSPTVAFGDARQWDAWAQRLSATKGAKLLLKTSLAGKDTLPVDVEKKKQISYIRDFEFDGQKGRTVSDQLEVGVFLRWRPQLARDGRHITLDCELRVSDVVQPMRVVEKPVGKLKARVQVPDRRESVQRTSVTLPLGGVAAFAVGPDRVVLLRARIGSPRGTAAIRLPEAEVGVRSAK
ncbi:MAG: hypothetical protein AAGD14_06895 [Planctomycetota bacterium]